MNQDWQLWLKGFSVGLILYFALTLASISECLLVYALLMHKEVTPFALLIPSLALLAIANWHYQCQKYHIIEFSKTLSKPEQYNQKASRFGIGLAWTNIIFITFFITYKLAF